MGIIMKQKKINCWEFKRCGREPGGINSAEGVCPVALEQRADGVHDGLNEGVAAGCFEIISARAQRKKGANSAKPKTQNACNATFTIWSGKKKSLISK